jgi:hypothetical protein
MRDVLILDKNFNQIADIDTIQSFLWIERYSEAGEFEFYTQANADIIYYMQIGNYLVVDESEKTMVIENIELTSAVDEGDIFIVTGTSLEGLLRRRICWGQYTFNGSLHSAIKTLVTDAFIGTAVAGRRIPNFVFQDSTDARILAMTVDIQLDGENLYEIVSELCLVYGIGYKIILSPQNQFIFSLYMGNDRGPNQTQFPEVVFSPEYENVLRSTYRDNSDVKKNITYVLGEIEVDDGTGSGQTVPVRQVYLVDDGALGTGVDRMEMFTDSTGIRDEGDGAYPSLMIQSGRDSLVQNREMEEFDGEFETTILFQYEQDFFMGDIVHVANAWGITKRSRVVEFVRSLAEDGLISYPRFEIVN